MYEKFAALLQESNKTPYQVSKDTGIAQSVLSDWKRGRSSPKIDKLKILADYFGVSVEYFLSEDQGETGEGILRQISEAATTAMKLKMNISLLRDQNPILSNPLLSSVTMAEKLIAALERLEMEVDGILAEQKRNKEGV